MYLGAHKLALSKPTSDHCPILLDSNNEDAAPLLSALSTCGWKTINFLVWSSVWLEKASAIVGQVFRLSLKLKRLKQNIKEWIKINFGAVESLKSEHLTRVAETGLQGRVLPAFFRWIFQKTSLKIVVWEESKGRIKLNGSKDLDAGVSKKGTRTLSFFTCLGIGSLA